jgi:hypothetical protein
MSIAGRFFCVGIKEISAPDRDVAVEPDLDAGEAKPLCVRARRHFEFVERLRQVMAARVRVGDQAIAQWHSRALARDARDGRGGAMNIPLMEVIPRDRKKSGMSLMTHWRNSASGRFASGNSGPPSWMIPVGSPFASSSMKAPLTFA